MFIGSLALSAGAADSARDAKIREVGDNFEAMMLQRMQEDMEKSQGLLQVGDDNPFAPSNAEMIYRSMINQAMMQKLARERPLGVGNMVERQLRGEGGIKPRVLLKSEEHEAPSQASDPDAEGAVASLPGG